VRALRKRRRREFFARLIHRAIEKVVALAKREGVELRQSYLRVAKRAAIMAGRYTHV
jgi:IS5 family transposase